MTMLNRWVILRASGLLLFLIAGMPFHSVAFARPQEAGPAPPENLVPGQVATRAIWKKDLHFLFEGKAGEVITLRVTSKTSGLDPHVSLIDPEDVEEVSDDDSGEQGNSLIQDHILKQTGIYTVIVATHGKAQ
jgi:hypothetical protein